jgi:hypothetical protein
VLLIVSIVPLCIRSPGALTLQMLLQRVQNSVHSEQIAAMQVPLARVLDFC